MSQSKKVTPQMIKSVSPYRRELLEREVEAGVFSDGRSKEEIEQNKLTKNSYVVSAMSKKGQVASGGGGYRGTNASDKQAPDIYSPLWLTSNLSLPRDRATINAWCRSYFALNGLVQNSINLHSTYPISKLNIKCKNKEIENFFSEMAEEIDLMNSCVQIAQEFWLLGEAFPYLELDENQGKWTRIVIQNPDYIDVKNSNIDKDPILMLIPDANLKRIVTSGKSADIEQRKQLDPYIVECVKKGQNIPLDPLNISMIAKKIAPYENRGTGLPVSIFRQLMLFDKIRECYDENTQVLTDNGFKYIYELLEFTDDNINIVGKYKDKNVKLIDNLKIACYDKTTNSIKYSTPKNFTLGKYEGEMISIKNNNIDICVTPNHKMYAKEYYKGSFEDISAEDLFNKLSNGSTYRFNSVADYNGNNINKVKVGSKEINIETYLRFLGHVISEGCLTTKNTVQLTQSINSIRLNSIKQSCYQFLKEYDKKYTEYYRSYKKFNSSKSFKKIPPDAWNIGIYSKELNLFLRNEIGLNDKCDSLNKQIPRWILDLDKKYLSILLNSLLEGDGSFIKNQNGNAFKYYTSSKELKDNIQEILFKLGFSSNAYSRLRNKNTEYCISWSDNNVGTNPIIRKKNISKTGYNGSVWCFETDTGYFVTRRNNKIAIQGNCHFAQADDMINPLTIFKIGSESFKPTPADLEAYKNIVEQATYDKNYKLFTHEALDVQVIGKSSGILDTSGHITQLIKEIYTGLMVPSVIMDGGSDTTYSNGGVALDVLKQRYMQFRNMLAAWLKRKVFTPIAIMQDFYEYKDGKKTLIIPDVDWNHMALFDTNEHIGNLIQLSAGQEGEKRVSTHELHRALGLDFDDQMQKIKKENIANMILMKEKQELEKMTLNELRSLSDDDEIQQKQETMEEKEKLPGEEDKGAGGLPGMPDMPDLGGGGMPDMPDLGSTPPAGGEPPK